MWQRIAAALVSEQVVANLVRKVAREEGKRLEMQLELQVLEQHLSLATLDDPDQPELKQNVVAKRKALKDCTDGVFEVLEELRCEAADIED